MLNSKYIRDYISKRAFELGFLNIGFAKAIFLEDEAPRLEKWLSENRHGEMEYMENNFDKRLDPRLLVEDTKTVISFTYNYYTEVKQQDPEAPRLSTYAFGRDYHKVIKKKLKILLQEIQSNFGDINGRYFVDSAPILEKAWAKNAGIGWVGKNANLLSRENGSFYFLAQLLLDIELEPSVPFLKDFCGTCTKCIDACPTEAIIAPYQVDGSKCISYLTIELKEAIPSEFKGKMENWMFGCDICQEVCPWNRFSKEHTEPDFNPNKGMLELTKKDWNALTEETFRQYFSGSAVNRTKFSGLKRNIKFLRDE